MTTNNTGGSSGGGGGGGTVITGVTPPQKPLNLLNAVSEIQQMSAVEKDITTPLDDNYLSTQTRIDFFMVGMKNALTHFLFVIVLTPLTIGVLHHLIPLFGEKHSLFSDLYAILLSFSISLGFGFFLSTLKTSYVGTVSKGMIRNLFGGLALGEFLKVGLAAIIYSLIYIKMTPTTIADFILFLNKYLGALFVKFHIDDTAMYYWLIKFRDVFPLSSVFVFLSGLFMVGIPIVIISIYTYRLRKGEEDL